VDIRREIQKLYVKKGGVGALFEAEAFWPHVTVGFTYRDMFLEDGVFKGHNSCFGRVEMVNVKKRITYEGGDDSSTPSGNDGGSDGGSEVEEDGN